jgi:hypothetical protein
MFMSASGLGRVKRLWRNLIDLQSPPLQLGSFHSANFGCFVIPERAWRSVEPVRAS